MPRKVYINNWITKIQATPGELAEFKSQYPPSKCIIQSSDENPISDVIVEHPITMQLGNLGATSFVPSPIPGTSNVMYKEKIIWSAILEDGTIITQYDGENERSSEDIPRQGLRKFCLIAKKNNKAIFIQELRLGWKFFYRRRTAMDQGGPIEVVHIVGTKHQIGNDWLMQATFVYEHDLSVISGDVVIGKPEPILGKLFKWRHPVQLVDADEQIIS